MHQNECIPTYEFHTKSQISNELMVHEIQEILLISSPYNIFNFEEDGSLTSKIINEYKGLNLCRPPKLTGVSSAKEALSLLSSKDFDMVLIVPNLEETDPFSLGLEIKKIKQAMPVILLSPSFRGIEPISENDNYKSIDKTFIWTGNPDLLLALIKNTEDHLDVDQAVPLGDVRVLILVEDSPEYYSFFLPVIYKEITTQTQALLKIGLNDNQKALTLHSRPKILLAQSYEEAMKLYQKYRHFILCVISDTRFPRDGKIDAEAGIALLNQIRKDCPEIPLLLMSSESENKKKIKKTSSLFLDKNSLNLSHEIHNFFQTSLGFGDFIFRLPDGRQIDRASNLLQLEAKLADIPDDSIAYHSDQNHFSIWLMARAEIDLALKFRSVKRPDFRDMNELRQYIISNIHTLRKNRQKGIVSTFDGNHFDSDIREFVKIGQGSLGGKARGLAFMSALFRKQENLLKKYPEINIIIPKTLVICTDVFESFIMENNLQNFVGQRFRDEEVDESFLKAKMPELLVKKLESYLIQVKFPLAVRASSQRNDNHFQPYAGIYRTYMIPNNHPNLKERLAQLVKAIKLVYASTYHEAPKAFYKNTSNQPFSESMAIIVQELAGDEYGDYFYPAISGVAQSYNYYPFSHMKPEEGIAHITLGLGKKIVGSEKSLRFSPKYPSIIPQFSKVEDILKHAQRFFYALKIRNYPQDLNFQNHSNLEIRGVDDAENEFPVKALASTYIHDENRIRDTWHLPGPKILTFSKILKYNFSRLPSLLVDLQALGQKSLGCPVEIDFAVNLHPEKINKIVFYLLQIRPMTADRKRHDVQITENEVESAICYSSQALGNGVNKKMTDIVYVKNDNFKPETTVEIAEEINKINANLLEENRCYLLVGPGRWGSSDKFLGIPVKWNNISGAGAIVELRNKYINADPSQGTHFFQNITSKGIHYITINEIAELSSRMSNDYFDWKKILSFPTVSETAFMRHVRLEKPLLLKIDGRKSQAVIMRN